MKIYIHTNIHTYILHILNRIYLDAVAFPLPWPTIDHKEYEAQNELAKRQTTSPTSRERDRSARAILRRSYQDVVK